MPRHLPAAPEGRHHTPRDLLRRLRLTRDKSAWKETTVGNMYQHGLPKEAGATPGRRRQGGGPTIARRRARTTEVHHIEKRLDLDLAQERPQIQPPLLIRASGYLLLLAIVVAVCYSAAV